MPKMKWTEAFSVGVQVIDDQHKKWIDIINKYHDSIIDKSDNENLTAQIMDEMMEYSKFHFAFEEAILEKNGYPKIADHRALHNNYIEMLLKKVQEEQNGELMLSRDVMVMLINWLQNHILFEDMKYKSFFKANDIVL